MRRSLTRGGLAGVMALALLLLSGCRPEIPAEAWKPSVPLPAQNHVYLQSDQGDYVGGGRTELLTEENSELSVTYLGGTLQVAVYGDNSWTGRFKPQNSEPDLQKGYYPNATRYPYDPNVPTMDWSGEGRGCNTLTGWFGIDQISFNANHQLQLIDLRFEQHCDGAVPAQRGRILWAAGSTVKPPGPVNPPPTDLWKPTPGTTPATGNYVHLVSDIGDYVGSGRTMTYTPSTARLGVSAAGGQARVTVTGNDDWDATFQAMNSVSTLQPGYYPDLQAFPFHNAAKGGMSWAGEGRACNTLSGWFTVDQIRWNGTALDALDLRFEQHCEGSPPALRGQIHWDASDTTAPPGPVNPPPANLWKPAAGTTPATGNYIHLASDTGDYVGAGRTVTYTPADARIGVSAYGAEASVYVAGDDTWSATFKGMDSISRLEPGYYGNLQRWPFHNPIRGGLDWSGNGRGCNTLTGWFTVDQIRWNGTALDALDLRFEQHCEGSPPALRGQIHWDASDTTAPPGPVNPPPANLWKPAAGTTPATGNYIHLVSDTGDYIGAGRTTTYTPANARLGASITGNHAQVTVTGDDNWYGDFQAMDGLTTMQPGYYGSLRRYPFHNPIRGGLSWSGNGRGCNTLTGWFVVDQVRYDADQLTRLDLRFEQHCEGGGPALRGEIHWDASDTTAPPGPVNPPPANLWKPAAGTTPATGNYVHLASEGGDYVGGGRTATYTRANARVGVSVTGNHAQVTVTGDQVWSGDFQAMDSIGSLQPGYYPNLQRWPFHNPIRGGLSWSGDGRGCNSLTGWFVVDQVRWDGSSLAALDLRFEQHCEGGGAALRGEVHWDASDTTAPPGPVNPPPANLWKAAAGTTPATGNYVHLASDPGDYIGGGRTVTYAGSELDLTASGATIHASVNGPTWWFGDFVGMAHLSRVEPGYYGGLQRYPFHNPVKGGLDWSGDGRGCNTLTGWFTVDQVRYDGDRLVALDLRFEQHCEGTSAALHGQIHWVDPSGTAAASAREAPPATTTVAPSDAPVLGADEAAARVAAALS